MKRRDLIAVIYGLRDAGRGVVSNWEGGDLAAAVRELDATLLDADRAIEWWESDDAEAA